MRIRSGVFGLAVLFALAGGACEKQVREARSGPTSPAGTELAAGEEAVLATTTASDNSSTTQSADTQPAYSLLTIDGLERRFPLTKILVREGSPAIAEMFSDLPKSSLRKYDGNELYLEMKIEGAAPEKLDGKTWRFKSASSGKANTPDGIFLNGQSTHLQPQDVYITFESRQEPGAKHGQLVAVVRGQFRCYEAGAPEGLAPFASVSGQLPIEVVAER